MMYKTHKIFLALLLTCAIVTETKATASTKQSSEDTTSNESWLAINTGELFEVGFDDPGTKKYPIIERKRDPLYNCYLRTTNLLYRRVQNFNPFWGQEAAKWVWLDVRFKTSVFRIKITIETDAKNDADGYKYQKAIFHSFNPDMQPTDKDAAIECGKGIGYFLESINNKSYVFFTAFKETTNAYYIFKNLFSCAAEIMNQVKLNKLKLETALGLLEGMQDYASGYLEHYKYRTAALNSADLNELQNILNVTNLQKYNEGGYIATALGSIDMLEFYGFVSANKKYIAELREKLQNQPQEFTLQEGPAQPFGKQLSAGTLNASRIGTGK